MGIIRLLGEQKGWSDKKIKRAEGILDLFFWGLFLAFFVEGYLVISAGLECSKLVRCEYFGGKYNASYIFQRDLFNTTINSSLINISLGSPCSESSAIN